VPVHALTQHAVPGGGLHFAELRDIEHPVPAGHLVVVDRRVAGEFVEAFRHARGGQVLQPGGS